VRCNARLALYELKGLIAEHADEHLLSERCLGRHFAYSTKRTGRIGYKVMIRDYNETVSYQKQLALEKVEGSAPVKDISEAPEQAQNLFNRLWGEKDEED
jgi:hypothetical protein